MMGSSAGSGSGSRYLNPHLVIQLVIRRMPRELLAYLGSIPGTSRDLDCHQVKLVGKTLLTLVSQPRRFPLHEEDRQILCWAELAWFHATRSRFCALQMVGNPSNFTSDAGHYTHPHNSSSYAGRMLTHEPDSIELRHAAVHNQLSASNSRIHGAIFPPLRASSSDGPYMHLHNLSSYSRRMLNSEPDSNELIHSAASRSRTPAATFLPLQENFDDAQEFAELSLGRPGSEQFTPQMLIRNREDIKGKRPASEVKQIKAKILRLRVASMIRKDGFKSAAGVLIRDGTTAPFMTASCFHLYVDPALLFATACCEGIRTALLYEPTTIVLESHLVPLLEHLVATQSQAVVQLDQLLGSNPPYFIIQTIPEESNGAACQLVRHALQMEKSKMVFSCNDPPDWLVPYLYQ